MRIKMEQDYFYASHDDGENVCIHIQHTGKEPTTINIPSWIFNLIIQVEGKLD